MRRRTSAMGHSAEKNSRAEFFKTCWVSVNPNCMTDSSITLGQPEDEMSDDVALDLGRAGLDGVAARAQIGVGPLAFVEGAVATLGQLGVGAEDLHGHLLEALIELTPEDFLDGAFGAGLAGFDDAADDAHLIQAHDFDFGVALREFLADDGIVGGGAPIAGDP